MNADSVVVPTSNMAMRRALLVVVVVVLGGPGPALVGSSRSPADNNNNNKNTIRLGYLMYNRQTAMAIHLAIRRARMDGLLRGYNFR